MKVSESRKTDRILVSACAVVGIGLGSWAILQARGFADVFESPRDQSPNRGAEVLEQAKLDVATTQNVIEGVKSPAPGHWSYTEAVGRKRGFLVSTSLVFLRGSGEGSDQIVDLDKETPRLRDEFPNDWLTKYNLQLEYANVGDLDHDKDFFTNLEEFTFGEKLGQQYNPADAESHPPLHFRLRYAKYVEEPYSLKFTSAAGNDFFLRHDDENNRAKRWSSMASLSEDANGNGQLDEGEDANANGTLDSAQPFGRKTDEGRFIIRGSKKDKVTENGIEKEITILTIEDFQRPELHPMRKFDINEGDTIMLPIRRAVFDFAPTPGTPLEKTELDTFPLPGTTEPTYTLLKVTDTEATLTTKGATKNIVIPIGAEPQP